MADPRLRLPDLPQILDATPREASQIYVESLPAQLRLLCASPSVLAAFSSATLALLLIVFIREIAAGRAFERRARRTARLSGPSSSLAASKYVQPGVVPEIQETYSFVAIAFPSWPVSWVITGLGALVVCVALRDGARLEKEAVFVV